MPPASRRPAPDDALQAAIYGRVSKIKAGQRSAETRSVPEQNTANTDACRENGWHIKEVFAELDRSASRFARKGRPEWDRLLAQLEAGTFDVLVLWESSRGDRKPVEWMSLLQTCREQGVLIHVTSHDRTYNMQRARDWKVLADDGVDSAFESERLSGRLRRTTRSRAAAGAPHGRRLYGYRRRYDPDTGDLVGQDIDQDEAAVIRDIADMIKQGTPLNTIARILNDRGTPSPRGAKWTSTPIKRLVINPSYVGYRVHLGVKIKSTEQWFPRILDDHTYYLIVAKLTDPARGGARPSAIRHLLSGIAVCGVCGSPCRPRLRRGINYYSCVRKYPVKEKSFHVGRHKERVDTYVESLAVALLMSRPTLAALAVTGDVGDEVGGVLAEVEEKRARLEEFYVQAAQGKLSATGLARVEGVLTAEIEAAEQKMKRIHFPAHVASLVMVSPEAVPAAWDALELPQKRELLVWLFEKIAIMPVGPGRKNIPDEESVDVVVRSHA
ncbi:recombinase family protein [Streptosporangium sp. NPDC050855]|uniref:recombinase family protein n=1 Tax=Streptosporangium sp. NPDC050855 TaxID=3366194 RepID=UPI0037AB3C3F